MSSKEKHMSSKNLSDGFAPKEMTDRFVARLLPYVAEAYEREIRSQPSLILSVTARLDEPDSMPEGPPRQVLATPGQSFADLATAIDVAYDRISAKATYVFALPDGQLAASQDFDEYFELASSLQPCIGLEVSDSFTYTCRRENVWRHEVEVLAKVPPEDDQGSASAPADDSWHERWRSDFERAGGTGHDQ